MALARQTGGWFGEIRLKRLPRESFRRHDAEHRHHAVVFVVGQVTVKGNVANERLRESHFDPYPTPDGAILTLITSTIEGPDHGSSLPFSRIWWSHRSQRCEVGR